MARQGMSSAMERGSRLDVVYGSRESWVNFLRAIHSPATRKTYVDSVDRYLRYLAADNPDTLLEGTARMQENQILGFIDMQKAQGLSSSVIRTRLAAIKLFYEMNRVPLSWTFIRRTIGRTKKKADKAYTKEQIAKVLSIADHREKAMVALLASTGIREGAISELDVGHLTPVEKYAIYKIKVYEGFDEQYVTYCTPECKIIIDEYLQYRKRYGEDINPKSPLIREQFNKGDPLEARHPKRMSTRMIINSLTKLLVAAGVRPRIALTEGQAPGRIRHEVKLAHGFRKYYDTTMSLAGVSEIWTQLLEGHSIGLKGAYLRPSEDDLLEGNDRMRGYLAALDDLTINDANRLRRENDELKNKANDIESVKLELAKHKKDLDQMRNDFDNVRDRLLAQLTSGRTSVSPDEIIDFIHSTTNTPRRPGPDELR